MIESTKRNRMARGAALVAAGVLALVTTPVGAQSTAPSQSSGTSDRGQFTYTVAGVGAESRQLPQDIRIMQRIVGTALDEVEAPDLPEELRGDDAGTTTRTRVRGVSGQSQATIWAFPSTRSAFRIGGRDVTGFYMQGYGYLFTVSWQVAPRGIVTLGGVSSDERMVELNALAAEARRAADATEAVEARAAEEAEQALIDERERLEERQVAWEAWSEDYRSMLADALHEVVARYGSTLRRATDDEAITFIADFGGGEAETVTVTARRGDLTGSPTDNRGSVRIAVGATDVSSTLRTELKIMAEIIDSSLQAESSNDTWVYVGDGARHFGGSSSFQYVPGYGVLFRKSARLNLATQVIRGAAAGRNVAVTPGQLRQSIEQGTEEQREAYAEHLTELKRQTAEVLSIYGPTLTELDGTDWVGVFYNVGSAAGLLEGGISNFLVQARMTDIRQAGSEADGAGWLADRLVTNERQD